MTTLQAETANLPEFPEPSAWVNFNVLTQKERLDRLPITTLQPGVYQHKKLYSEEQMRAYALSAISAHEAEVGRLRAELDLLKTNDYFAICDAHKAMNLTLTITGPVDANGKMCPLCCSRSATRLPAQGEKS